MISAQAVPWSESPPFVMSGGFKKDTASTILLAISVFVMSKPWSMTATLTPDPMYPKACASSAFITSTPALTTGETGFKGVLIYLTTGISNKP